MLRGPEVAVLASLGVANVEVVRRPRVAILSTGDELLTPGESPAPGKIYDSNSYGLSALVTQYGGVPQRFGIAQDTVPALTAKINEALETLRPGDHLSGSLERRLRRRQGSARPRRSHRLLDRADETRQAARLWRV